MKKLNWTRIAGDPTERYSFKQTQHTSGPWKTYHSKAKSGEQGVITQNGKVRIAWMDFWGEQIETGNLKPDSEIDANARLIAAAPELLEACLQAVMAIPTDHGAFETVRNAISKATGT